MTLPPTKLSERAYLGAKAVEALEQDLDSALKLLDLLTPFIYDEFMVRRADELWATYRKLLKNKAEREGLE